MSTSSTTMELDDPRELPGHEAGRQRLVNAMSNADHFGGRLQVRGHWEHDTFIVVALRYWDTEYDCWTSDLGAGGWSVVGA